LHALNKSTRHIYKKNYEIALTLKENVYFGNM